MSNDDVSLEKESKRDREINCTTRPNIYTSCVRENYVNVIDCIYLFIEYTIRCVCVGVRVKRRRTAAAAEEENNKKDISYSSRYVH